MIQYKIVATREQVSDMIKQIAARIAHDNQTASPLFVALLRGAAPFSSRLMFELTKQAPNLHPEIDYMMVSTYCGGKTPGEPHIVTDLAPDTVVKDRPVIVIDDVLDKGVTANFVFNHLKMRGASSVALAVLAQKKVEQVYPITADYCGFTFGNEWLVGMGMDDAETGVEAYRWLHEIRAKV